MALRQLFESVLQSKALQPPWQVEALQAAIVYLRTNSVDPCNVTVGQVPHDSVLEWAFRLKQNHPSYADLADFVIQVSNKNLTEGAKEVASDAAKLASRLRLCEPGMLVLVKDKVGDGVYRYGKCVGLGKEGREAALVSTDPFLKNSKAYPSECIYLLPGHILENFSGHYALVRHALLNPVDSLYNVLQPELESQVLHFLSSVGLDSDAIDRTVHTQRELNTAGPISPLTRAPVGEVIRIDESVAALQQVVVQLKSALEGQNDADVLVAKAHSLELHLGKVIEMWVESFCSGSVCPVFSNAMVDHVAGILGCLRKWVESYVRRLLGE